MGEITKKDYNQVVEAILKHTLVPIPDEKEGYQIVMGEKSVNAKIKRMVSESKKSVLLILSDRMLASMFHSEILDMIIKTNSKGIEVKLRTPSKKASDYLGQIGVDSNINNNLKLTLSISEIYPISIDLVIVDESYAIIIFASYKGPGALTSDQAGLWTNHRDIVSFYKYLFERLP
jgi:sugar-specific transcriptional regulator TrmB